MTTNRIRNFTPEQRRSGLRSLTSQPKPLPTKAEIEEKQNDLDYDLAWDWKIIAGNYYLAHNGHPYYTIQERMLRTQVQMDHWINHLREKNWVKARDLQQIGALLYEYGRPFPPEPNDQALDPADAKTGTAEEL